MNLFDSIDMPKEKGYKHVPLDKSIDYFPNKSI